MASIAEINLLFVRLRIGRTTKMLHSANAEGVPSQKTRTHLSAKLSTTRVKGSRVHALPLPRTRNQSIADSQLANATAYGRANCWGVCFVPGHGYSRSGCETLVAGIQSGLKPRTLLEVVSVHNCSLRR